MFSPFLSDVGVLSLAAAGITVAFVVPFRLLWRHGKKLEEP